MLDQFWEYTVSQYREIPVSVYEALVALLCVGSVVIFGVRGVRKGWRIVGLLLLAGYVFLLLGSTVIFRCSSDAIWGHNFQPFWSYRAIMSGESPQLLAENIMNVLVFVPVGVLLFFFVHGLRCMVRHGWLIALLVGLFISVSIEVLQSFLHRGFSEVDDVTHNTLGCLIGYGLYRLIRSICFNFEGN